MSFLQTPGNWRSKQAGAPLQTLFTSPAEARRNRNSSYRNSKSFPKRDVLMRTDAPVVAEISRADLDQFLSPAVTKITDLKHLASYNWLEEKSPAIAVPGAPALYSPPIVPPKLNQDTGEIFIDQNSARNSNSPLEPLFRSLFTLNPNFNISDIDLVTDRNNIRKLFRFVNASSKDAFEIKVEIVGEKTTLFTRVSLQDKIIAKGSHGFGHNFERAITKDHMGTGHHRIVRYQFGGMKMIVRHETDGYLDERHDSFGLVAFSTSTRPVAESKPEKSLETAQATPAEGAGPPTSEILSQPRKNPPRKARTAPKISDTISNLLYSLTIADASLPTETRTTSSLLNPSATPYKPLAPRGLQVQNMGTLFPTSQILEIKTRAASKSLDLRETLPQLWISQTPNLIVGYHHSGGLFDKIEVKNMTSAIQEWEEENQVDLTKLVGLIKWVVEKVKGIEGRRGTVRFEGMDVIKIMGVDVSITSAAVASSPGMAKAAVKREEKVKKMMQRRALPVDLYEKWTTANERTEVNELEDNGGVSLA